VEGSGLSGSGWEMSLKATADVSTPCALLRSLNMTVLMFEFLLFQVPNSEPGAPTCW
jgi:hypothetical protein